MALVVVVPVYNEGENFREWWRRAGPHLPPGTVVRPVYDMPEDDTLPVIEALRREGAPIEPLRNRSRGVLEALVTGLRSVERGPVLVSMADLCDDLSVVPSMLAMYRDGCRVVCASRYMKGGRQIGGPFLKRTFSRAAGLALRWLGRFPTHDATNNFRLYDAALVREVGIESTGGFEVAIELTAKAHRRGVRVGQVPTPWRDRSAGTSRFRMWRWIPRYLRWWFYALLGFPKPKGPPADAPRP